MRGPSYGLPGCRSRRDKSNSLRYRADPTLWRNRLPIEHREKRFNPGLTTATATAATAATTITTATRRRGDRSDHKLDRLDWTSSGRRLRLPGKIRGCAVSGAPPARTSLWQRE